MSRVVLAEPGLLVIDDVLDTQVLGALRHELANGEYQTVHARGWDKAWRPWDGHPMRGPSVLYDPTSCMGGEGKRYPTCSSVDALVDEIRRAATIDEDLVGVEGRDWSALYLAPWLYPVGGALSRHRDGVRYSGAFTWFAHARWGTHWGGELVVEPPGADTLDEPGSEPWTEDTGTADGPGIGTIVSPWPNRLVLLGPRRPHRIARVDVNAGARVRSSIAGFFLRGP